VSSTKIYDNADDYNTGHRHGDERRTKNWERRKERKNLIAAVRRVMLIVVILTPLFIPDAGDDAC
jgi:hypothetical protein